MDGTIALPLTWCVTAFRLVGAVGIGFGAFTALLPDQSIALYQWIMERFNWRTEPINAARELRNTRGLGLCLVVLGAALLITSAALFAAEPTAPEVPMSARETATFAGGCFWCMEAPFEQLPGVISVTSGYTGGAEPNPTYEQVSSGSTGHCEAVQVVYDPSTVSYQQLLEVFWRNIDPTTKDAQFADHGTQYRTGIFYHTAEQQRLADASKAALAQSKKFGDREIVTEITQAAAFYPAEDYHQDYYKKNPLRYNLYKAGSGREEFIKKTWGGAH